MNSHSLRRTAVRGAFPLAAAIALSGACAPQDNSPGGSGSGGKAAGSGGAQASGGAPGTGGSGSGGQANATGGATGTGGASNASGGASATGGAPSTGGAPGSGGSAGGAATGGGGGGVSVTGGRGGAASGGSSGLGGGAPGLPETGSEGDGDSMVGPSYSTQADLNSKGNPKGKTFRFDHTSTIFNGKDSTLTKTPVNVTRTIQGYVPAMYKDGTPAPVLIIQDGPDKLSQISNALDNLTIATDPMRKLPPFIVIAVPAGGNDSIGSERGLEYDTLSDRYARYITQEVMPAVQNNLKSMYPNLKFDPNPSGRAAIGCSSGGAAAFTMAWFRPDLFSRVIAYSATLVAQQDPKAPESTMYPHGAWDYHSDVEIIKNDKSGREKQVRIFHNANQNDIGSTDPDSGRHNWLSAGKKTAAALKAKGFHYKFVVGQGAGHCAAEVQSATLADALVWVWRGYQQPAN